jgi:hypothetical protein
VLTAALSLPARAGQLLATTGPSTDPGLPGELQPHVLVLGDRSRREDKARIQLQGQFADAAGIVSDALVTLERSGRARLDGMRSDGEPILFDGDVARSTSAGLTDRDQSLLDAFAVDSIEGLVARVSSGAGVRLLGRGFRPETDPPQSEYAPAFDIFEIGGPIRTRPGQPVRTGRYYFDSKSGLLSMTRHREGARRFETRFSNWGVVDGARYPGLVERYENGTLVFRFATQAIATGPVGDISTFRLP